MENRDEGILEGVHKARITRRQLLLGLTAGAASVAAAACSSSAPAAPTAAPGGPATKAPAGEATKAPATAQQAPAQGTKTTLRWFFWTGSEVEVHFWEALAADAGKALGNIEIKFETDTFANFWTKLPILAASNTLGDIVGLQSMRTPQFTSRGVYMPLDDLVAKDPDVKINDFAPVIRDALSYKGKLYALAYDFGPYITYYNKTLFQKAGVPFPKDWWTAEEFLTTAKAVTKNIDGKDVFGYAAQNNWDQITPWLYSNGTDLVDPDFKKSNLSSPEVIETLHYFQDLQYKYKVAPPVTDPGNLQSHREAFYATRVAMYVDGPWNFVNLRSKLKDEWDVTTFPKGKKGSIPQVAGSGFGISAQTKYKEQAWQALKWLTSKESLERVAKAGRGFPGRISAQPAFYRTDVPPTNQQVIAKQNETGLPYHVNTVWQEIFVQLQRDLVDPIVLADKSVEETVKAAEPNFQALVDKGASQA